jgi:hypothetical protein
MAPQPRIDELRPEVEAAMAGRASLTTAITGMLEARMLRVLGCMRVCVLSMCVWKEVAACVVWVSVCARACVRACVRVCLRLYMCVSSACGEPDLSGG